MKNAENISSRIVYYGKAIDRITAPIIDMTLLSNKFLQEDKVLKKRVPFIIAESFQNVIRHGSEDVKLSNQSRKSDFFQVLTNGSEISVDSSNVVENNKIPDLVNQIETINSYSSIELKKLRDEKLINGDFSDAGGAGLGLIEIARKTGSQIVYKFITLNEMYSQFFMTIKLSSTNTSSKDQMNRLTSDFKHLKEDGVIALFEGSFTHEIDLVILGIFKDNLRIENYSNNTIPSQSLFQVLSNIVNLNKDINEFSLVNSQIKFYKKHNIFSLAFKTEISNEQLVIIRYFLNRIKIQSLSEIRLKHKEMIKQQNLNDTLKVQLGLYEIALFSKNLFEFSFDDSCGKMMLTIDFNII